MQAIQDRIDKHDDWKKKAVKAFDDLKKQYRKAKTLLEETRKQMVTMDEDYGVEMQMMQEQAEADLWEKEGEMQEKEEEMVEKEKEMAEKEKELQEMRGMLWDYDAEMQLLKEERDAKGSGGLLAWAKAVGVRFGLGVICYGVLGAGAATLTRLGDCR